MTNDVAPSVPRKTSTDRRRRLSSPRGEFKYVRDLQLLDLPSGWQCPEALDVIGHVSQRVVMIYIPRMSNDRPNSIYSNRPHYGGTGFAYYVDENIVKVRTNLHVIYNLEEASTAIVQFSLEVPGKRHTRVVRLYATDHDFHTNVRQDYSSFTCRPSRYLVKYLHLFQPVPVLWNAASCHRGAEDDAAGDDDVDGGSERGVMRRSSETAETKVVHVVVGEEQLDVRGARRSPKAAVAVKKRIAVVGEGRFSKRAVDRTFSESSLGPGRKILDTTERRAVARAASFGSVEATRRSTEGSEPRSCSSRGFIKTTDNFPRGFLHPTRNTTNPQIKHYGSITPEFSNPSGLNFENESSTLWSDITTPSLARIQQQLTLEYGDFVAILSHPQGSDKCFSVGRAAIADPRSFRRRAGDDRQEWSARPEHEMNTDSFLPQHEGAATAPRVDLVNDRFRACRNRVYHTHTTFGCSGAPVLLFKRSMQHLQIPVVDYSQHSGTCVFKGGANLGFATCFTPPIHAAPGGALSDAQQCFSVFGPEQLLVRVAEAERAAMRLSSSSDDTEVSSRVISPQHLAARDPERHRRGMVHVIPSADSTDTTHIVEHSASETEAFRQYCYTIDRGAVARIRILPEVNQNALPASPHVFHESPGWSLPGVGLERRSPERSPHHLEAFVSAGEERGGNDTTDDRPSASRDSVSLAFGRTESSSTLPQRFLRPENTQPTNEEESFPSFRKTPEDDPSQRGQSVTSELSLEEGDQQRVSDPPTGSGYSAGVCSLEGVLGNNRFPRKTSDGLPPAAPVPRIRNPTVSTEVRPEEEQTLRSGRTEQGTISTTHSASSSRLEMAANENIPQALTYCDSKTGAQIQVLSSPTPTEPNEVCKLSDSAARKNNPNSGELSSEVDDSLQLNTSFGGSIVTNVETSSLANVLLSVGDLSTQCAHTRTENRSPGPEKASYTITRNTSDGPVVAGLSCNTTPDSGLDCGKAATSDNGPPAHISSNNAESRENYPETPRLTQPAVAPPTQPRLATISLVLKRREASRTGSPSQPGNRRVAWMTLTRNVRDNQDGDSSRGILANERDWPALHVVSRLRSVHARKGLESRRRRKSSSRGEAGRGSPRSPVTFAVRKKNVCTWRAKKSKPLSHASLKKHLGSTAPKKTCSAVDDENEESDICVESVDAQDRPLKLEIATVSISSDQGEDKSQSSSFASGYGVDAMLQISPDTAAKLPAQLSFDACSVLNETPEKTRAASTSSRQVCQEASTQGESAGCGHKRENFDAELLEFFSAMTQNSDVSGLSTDLVSKSSARRPSRVPDVSNGDWLDEENNDPSEAVTEVDTKSDLSRSSPENSAEQLPELPSDSGVALIYRDSDFDSLGDSLSAPRNSYTLHQLKVMKNELDKTSRQTETEGPSCSVPSCGEDDIAPAGQDETLDTSSKAGQSMLGLQEMAEEFSKRDTPKMNSERGRMREVTDIHRIQNYCLELESQLRRHQKDVPEKPRTALQNTVEEPRMSGGVNFSSASHNGPPEGHRGNGDYFQNYSKIHPASSGVITGEPTEGDLQVHSTSHYSDIHRMSFDRRRSLPRVPICQTEEGLSKDHLMQRRLLLPLADGNICPVDASSYYRSKLDAHSDPGLWIRCADQGPDSFSTNVSTTTPQPGHACHVMDCASQRTTRENETKQRTMKMAKPFSDNAYYSSSFSELPSVGTDVLRPYPPTSSIPRTPDDAALSKVADCVSWELLAQPQTITGLHVGRKENTRISKDVSDQRMTRKTVDVTENEDYCCEVEGRLSRHGYDEQSPELQIKSGERRALTKDTMSEEARADLYERCRLLPATEKNMNNCSGTKHIINQTWPAAENFNDPLGTSIKRAVRDKFFNAEACGGFAFDHTQKDTNNRPGNWRVTSGTSQSGSSTNSLHRNSNLKRPRNTTRKMTVGTDISYNTTVRHTGSGGNYPSNGEMTGHNTIVRALNFTRANRVPEHAWCADRRDPAYVYRRCLWETRGSTPPDVGRMATESASSFLEEDIQTQHEKFSESTHCERAGSKAEFRGSQKQPLFDNHPQPKPTRVSKRDYGTRKRLAPGHGSGTDSESAYDFSRRVENQRLLLCQREYAQFELATAPSAASSTDSSSHSSPVKNGSSGPDPSRTSFPLNSGEMSYEAFRNSRAHESEAPTLRSTSARAEGHRARITRPPARAEIKPAKAAALRQALHRLAERRDDSGRGRNCHSGSRGSGAGKHKGAVQSHANVGKPGGAGRSMTGVSSAFDRFLGGGSSDEDVPPPFSGTLGEWKGRNPWTDEIDGTACGPRLHVHNISSEKRVSRLAPAHKDGKTIRGYPHNSERGKRSDGQTRAGSYIDDATADVRRTYTRSRRSAGKSGTERSGLSLSTAFERFFGMQDAETVPFAGSTPNADASMTTDSDDWRPENDLYDLNSVVRVVLEMGLVYTPGPGSQPLPTSCRHVQAEKPEEPVYVDMSHPSLGLVPSRHLAKSPCIHHLDQSLDDLLDLSVHEATQDCRSAANRGGDGCFRPSRRGECHNDDLNRAPSPSKCRRHQHGSGALEGLSRPARLCRPTLTCDTGHAAAFVPDPNWIFTGRMPELPPMENRALSKDRHGQTTHKRHEARRGCQATFKLNCLNCARTPSTPLSSGSEVFRFPSVNDALQGYFSNRDQTALGESSWSRHRSGAAQCGGSFFVENPLLRNKSRFRLPQQAGCYHSSSHRSPQHQQPAHGCYSREPPQPCVCDEAGRGGTQRGPQRGPQSHDHRYCYHQPGQPTSDDQPTYGRIYPHAKRLPPTDWDPNDLNTPPALHELQPQSDPTRRDIGQLAWDCADDDDDDNNHASSPPPSTNGRLHIPRPVETAEMHQVQVEASPVFELLETACIDTVDVLDTSFLTTLRDMDIIQRFQSDSHSQSDAVTSVETIPKRCNAGPSIAAHAGNNTARGRDPQGNILQGNFPEGNPHQGTTLQTNTPGNTYKRKTPQGNAKQGNVSPGGPNQDGKIQQLNITERNTRHGGSPEGISPEGSHPESYCPEGNAHLGNAVEGNSRTIGITPEEITPGGNSHKENVAERKTLNGEAEPRRGLYTKNERTKRTRNLKYTPRRKRGSAQQDVNRSRSVSNSPYRKKGGEDWGERGTAEGRKEKPSRSKQDDDSCKLPPAPTSSSSSTASSVKGSQDHNADCRTRWTPRIELKSSPGREVCYVTVPTDIRQRLNKVAKWITTQVFGCPHVRILTPSDAQTFRIQRNLNLTLQLMALKG